LIPISTGEKAPGESMASEEGGEGDFGRDEGGSGKDGICEGAKQRVGRD